MQKIMIPVSGRYQMISMDNLMKRLILFIILATMYLPVFSQFLLSGEFRPRTEYRDGYKTLLSKDQKPALVTSQRTRLNINNNDQRLSTRFAVQDVRTWGESASKVDISSMNVYEAWAELLITDALSVRVGRQEISFDQNRLLGASNWNDVGASHDLLLIKLHKNFDIQAGLAYNNDKTKVSESNYAVNNYKSLGFLRAEKSLGKLFNASVIGIADGYQKEADYKTIFQRLTYGGNLQLKNDSLRSRVYASFYFQNGKTPDGIPINAYFMSVSYDYAFTKSFNGIIAAEYFSGDDAFSTDSRYNSFNNLYGNGHGAYGNMDYFLQIDKDTRNGGLLNLNARGIVKFSRKATGELSYHYLSLTNNIIDSLSVPGNNIKANRYIGSEVDLTMKFKAADNVELSAGYSVMFATPTMEILKGGDHTKYQNWAWVMLAFKPEFLNTGKTR